MKTLLLPLCVLFVLVFGSQLFAGRGESAATDARMLPMRRAIEALGARYVDFPASTFLSELEGLQQKDAPIAEIEAFRYRVLVLENPDVDFTQVLFRASRNRKMPDNWQGNANYLRSSGKEYHTNFNDAIQVLDLETKKVQTIHRGADAREGLMDLCLHFDAERFLYTGVDLESNTFQIFEMSIDGSNQRQVTSVAPEIDNYNAAYLPSGKLLFCSTASLQGVPCVGGSSYVGNLFEIHADGSGMRQLTFDQENDWYPWVMEDGRVMFSRWEYTDNAHYFTRILMHMKPDGTSLRSLYGSNSYWPNTLFYAKQIPGSPSKFVAICSGHHGVGRAGELILFDAAKGDFEADGVIQRIPGFGQKVEPVVIDNYMRNRWPRFLHPYPLSEDYYLVSGRMSENERWALYLVDRFDNIIKLADAKKEHLFEPIPLKVRPTPPVLPDRRNFDADDSTLFIQDIYEGPGLKGIPRGTVNYLRLFTYGYSYRQHGGHSQLAIEGAWDTKRVLGTVPVEADGSVAVNIPHSLPISIQPLDEKGRALQLMRSWVTTMPGERLSCVGCHESSNTAPLSHVALAAQQAPKELTPWAGIDKPYGFGFAREVQPVLDRYCVGCHDGTHAELPNFKDTSRGNGGFGKSYHALHPYVRRPGPESDMHLLNPMEYHASTSELIQMLEKGHHGVQMDRLAWSRIVTWIDLNVPYHATWTEKTRDAKRTIQQAKRLVEYKKTYAGIDDDVEWAPPELEQRLEFVEPAKPTQPQAVHLEGWPLSEDAVRSLAGETRSVNIGGQLITFAKIPAGRFVMGSISGAADEAPQAVVEIEKAFWLSVKEVTNAEYQYFDSEHDSAYIDQQWKDHVDPGYPANEPTMPVIRVSWSEANAYCRWASQQTGLNITLPSEAQWEWAARAGRDQAFWFGATGYEQHANLADQSIGLLAVKGVNPKPIPESSRRPTNDFVPRDASFNDKALTPQGTGHYQASPWGLYDMHGNVAEWTRSDYAPYPYVADDGRNDLSTEARKVVRGGSWRDRPHRATASFRLPYEAHQKVFNVGFRIVIEE
ncbi:MULTISPECIES: SUMF1/EgtB/PvdO family nonheme iron enzyme [unclassified Lentimonas]|uniref:SUMF1/EgtB/PvdO family nonheme iron enzyme n=1 Tax=unclassified Lentimonas TaxID=2630993 RepID=UPI00132ABA5C|nr:MULTISPECIES: SUMF1/EgtB/PvdO family nonheme iron enzyme [unclassified Lentimonas]CAA6676807.1 FIG00898333: hypothetical protein [Lentimonas sp. CC4]CAA6686614.1 FIG00898333: hypothetical protein [Lentimonas sp. CC6]CAA7075809.1 FIG00898333: hypothetical protein [Lentimonas sp. CC4]CAA7168027.1 FIG00898333: hypothetical protein [Lentimonas sp. CC21]CAA7183028.1 FIG00898333: hypothetical protein [Lentimonas sp. CC8]